MPIGGIWPTPIGGGIGISLLSPISSIAVPGLSTSAAAGPPRTLPPLIMPIASVGISERESDSAGPPRTLPPRITPTCSGGISLSDCGSTVPRIFPPNTTPGTFIPAPSAGLASATGAAGAGVGVAFSAGAEAAGVPSFLTTFLALTVILEVLTILGGAGLAGVGATSATAASCTELGASTAALASLLVSGAGRSGSSGAALTVHGADTTPSPLEDLASAPVPSASSPSGGL
mmetsp:Transcript_49974/g.95455  ORF Transcript_49974/g.95455 Transcript_49974/m.95455 type:complete len:232 (+) Transcript_49974:767-1462(+)